MDNNENKKREPSRIVVGVVSIAYIVYMQLAKDIIAIYSSMPTEQAAPLIVTTIAVSLVKVAAISGGLLLVK